MTSMTMKTKLILSMDLKIKKSKKQIVLGHSKRVLQEACNLNPCDECNYSSVTECNFYRIEGI